MPNPLDYVTLADLQELELNQYEIETAYQPSKGGVYHCRGVEGKGKTLWIAHYYRYLIDSGQFTPFDAVGNMSFKGKYGRGFTTLKGNALHQYLWDLTHKPYKDKIVIIDEIDSEFPARFYPQKEQTEIAIRLWHTHKLGNYVLMSSHAGTSTDLIFHLASHYVVFPETPSFETNSLEFEIASNLENWYDNFTAHDVIKTMLIYSRQELTENTEEENQKERYSLQSKKEKSQAQDVNPEPNFLDIEEELANLS